MISVIIPVYNAGPYLRRCLDSVLRSSYQEFELILVNDGSTDDSPAICAEYAARDSRIVLLSQENRGVSAARNRALDVCRGEWVVFVDADDQISPAFLGLIAREEYQDQDLILFDLAESAEDFAAAAPPPETLYFGREAMPELLRCLFLRRQLVPGKHLNYVSPAAKAFRREWIERSALRFHPKISWGEDALWNVACYAKAARCAYTPIPVYDYCIHMDSSSHRFDPKLPDTLAALLQEMRTVLAENGLLAALEKDFYAYVQLILGYLLVWSVFSPDSTHSYRQKIKICRALRENELYCRAMQERRVCPYWSNRVLVALFSLRWYHTLGITSRLCNRYLSWRDSPQRAAAFKK